MESMLATRAGTSRTPHRRLSLHAFGSSALSRGFSSDILAAISVAFIELALLCLLVPASSHGLTTFTTRNDEPVSLLIFFGTSFLLLLHMQKRQCYPAPAVNFGTLYHPQRYHRLPNPFFPLRGRSTVIRLPARHNFPFSTNCKEAKSPQGCLRL